ncbi:MAG: metal ABC transporter substrate-binding protein [Nitrososphaerota archaeon]
MQKKLTLLAVSFVAVAAAVAVILASSVSQPSQTPSVAVTWGLLAEVVYRLGGGEIEVHQLLPPGTELHDWEPTPETVNIVGRSRLLIYTLRGLDDWAAGLADTTGVRSFESSQGILTELTIIDGGQTFVDPHIWLSPQNMVKIVKNVADELAKVFPEMSGKIMSNAESMVSELEDLDRLMGERLKPYVGRLFITQHDSFRYFAASYGLRAFGILGIEESEPTPSRLAEIHGLIRRERIGAVYGEDGIIHPILESIQADTGVKILMLYTGEGLTLDDVMKGVGYTAMMMKNLEALVEGFENG